MTHKNLDGTTVEMILNNLNGILNRLEVYITPPGKKTETSTIQMSDYNIKSDTIVCASPEDSDGVAVLRENSQSSLTVFLWKFNQIPIQYKIRRMVGGTVKALYDSMELPMTSAGVCKLYGREEIWFSSKVAIVPSEDGDFPNRSLRKNVVVDFSNAYMRVKAKASLKVNQQVIGTSKLVSTVQGGGQTTVSVKYKITAKADSNKLLYFL